MKFRIGDIVVLSDSSYWVSSIIGAKVCITDINTGQYPYEAKLLHDIASWETGDSFTLPDHDRYPVVTLDEGSRIKRILERYEI